ncbi:MAG TPA: transglutaminase domain-containing protein, partial [Candidatus Omnitrophota bacterium]|nr:transglutaminase domain-containing protein [Candidatus Omnitrophota bacterium]
IVAEFRDPKIGPQKMLETNKGGCQPKHNLLALYFKKLGIPVKYVTYEFKWDDPSFKYPPDLDEMKKVVPNAYHLAIKAKIENRWTLVDATWDKPLAKLGFPVNFVWDGMSDTKNAIHHISALSHETQEERYAYEMERRGLIAEEVRVVYSDFINKFNKWIISAR